MFRLSCFHSPGHHCRSKKTVQQSGGPMQAPCRQSPESQMVGEATNSAYSNSKSMEHDLLHASMDQVSSPSSFGGCWKSDDLNGSSCHDLGKDAHHMSLLKKSQSMGSCLDKLSGISCQDIKYDDKTDQGMPFDGDIEAKNIEKCTDSCPDSTELNDKGDAEIYYSNNDHDNNIAKLFYIMGEPSHCEGFGQNFVNHTIEAGYSPEGTQCDEAETHHFARILSTSPMGGSSVGNLLTPRSRSCDNLHSLYKAEAGLVDEDEALESRPCSYNMFQESNADVRSLLYQVDSCTSGACNEDEIKDGICSGEMNKSEIQPLHGCAVNNSDSSRDEDRGPLDNFEMSETLPNLSSLNNWSGLSSQEFNVKRIEEWIDQIDIHNVANPEDMNESTITEKDSHKASQPACLKLDARSPAMKLAYNYLSSLAPSSASVQIKNLGLDAIPVLHPFISLRVLNLSGNAIVQITAGALPRCLHSLNISKNNISTIEGLRELTRLRILDMRCNRISRIGHGLSSCSSLKELYLAGNKVSEVESLHRLLKLSILDLSFNKIATSKGLGQLAANTSLQVLNLEGNPALRNVGEDALKKHLLGLLPNLIYLNRQSVRGSSLKEVSDRSARSAALPLDRGSKAHKSSHKGTFGTSSVYKSSTLAKHSRNQHEQLPPASRTHFRMPGAGESGLQPGRNTLRRIRSEGAF